MAGAHQWGPMVHPLQPFRADFDRIDTDELPGPAGRPAAQAQRETRSLTVLLVALAVGLVARSSTRYE